MNGFTEHVSDSERGGVERLLTWGESRAMLPLVGRVAKDVIRLRQELAGLWPERDRLQRRRNNLDWPQRQRRYRVQEEIETTEKNLAAVEGELESLGVILLDAETGLIGFPTMVNNRPAFFSWRPDEESLAYWNFAGDLNRRPIPQEWTNPPVEVPARTKSKRKG